MEPQIKTDEYRLNEITERIMKCVYKVANTLGNGFLKKVYENALAHELMETNILVAQQNGSRFSVKGSWLTIIWQICQSRMKSLWN
jgi:GxxExxY protein